MLNIKYQIIILLVYNQRFQHEIIISGMNLGVIIDPIGCRMVAPKSSLCRMVAPKSSLCCMVASKSSLCRMVAPKSSLCRMVAPKSSFFSGRNIVAGR